MGEIYQGEIPDVLSAGEYDQGDKVLIYYDDLYDLVHPRKQQECKKELCPCCNYPDCGHNHTEEQPEKGESVLGPTGKLAAAATAWGLMTFAICEVVNLSLDKYRWPFLHVLTLAVIASIGYYEGKKKNS